MERFVYIDYETSDSRVNYGSVVSAALIVTDEKLKVKSILFKEELLDQKRRSNVLSKASGFGFYPSKEPVKIINIEYED